VLWEVCHRLANYHLVLSDWLWYTLLPLLAYTALLVAGIVLPISAALALFVIGSRNAAARDHGYPQRLGCRDLHGHRTLPAREHEPGLAGSCAGRACARSHAVGMRSVGSRGPSRSFPPDPPGVLSTCAEGAEASQHVGMYSLV
jgi:hypothetical protein